MPRTKRQEPIDRADSWTLHRRWWSVIGFLVVSLVVVACGAAPTTATSGSPQTTRTSTSSGTSGTSGTAPAQKVRVYAAAGAIRRGMTGDDAAAQGLIVAKEVDSTYRPTTAIDSPQQLSGRTATFNISPETIIVDGMFTGGSPTGT